MVSEARNITELERLEELDQKKGSSALKSHNEILDLFKELETIEENVKNPEVIEEIIIKPDIAKQEIEQTDITGEIEKDLDTSEDSVKKEKNHKLQFLSKLRKKKKPKEPGKRFLKLRRFKSIKTEDIHGELKPIKSTFTLKINDQGNLIGLNIKKPITKKEKKPLRLKLFKKGAAKEEAPAVTDVKGIKGIPVKIKGLFSKIRLKKSEASNSEGGGSKISGVAGKIKGIFSRKSK